MNLERVFGTSHSRSGRMGTAEVVARRREQQIEAIRRIAEASLAFSSVEQLIKETIAIAIDVLAAEAGSLQMYDPATESLIFRQVADDGATNLVGMAVTTSSGVNGRVFRSGVAELTSDVHHCPDWNPEVDQRTGHETKSLLTVPLRRPGGPIIGVLQVMNGEAPFDHFDLEVLEIIGGQLAHALAWAELRSESELRMSCLQALHETNRAQIRPADERAGVEWLLRQVIEHLPADAARFSRYNANSGTLQPLAQAGLLVPALDPNALVGPNSVISEVLSTCHTACRQRGEAGFAEMWGTEGFETVFIVPMCLEGEVRAIMEVYHRSKHETSAELSWLLEVLATRGAVVIDRGKHTDDIQTQIHALQSQSFGFQHQFNELSDSFDETLEKLAHALDIRNMEPEGHTLRVAEYTLRLARHLNVPEEDLPHLRRGALLHNVGKIAIPDAVLLKATALTDDEWNLLRRHPVFAFELLASVETLKPALDIPYCCHERWDGMGYPRGLQGEMIPLGARIFAVADAWDAMRADRPYRVGWPQERVRAHIIGSSGSQFDPYIVEAFEQISFE